MAYMKEMLMSILLALGLSGTQCGCVMNLEGSGETGLAYSSTSKVFAYHEVDGDKSGATCRSEVDLAPLLDMILEYQAAQSDPDPESEGDLE